MKSMKLFGMCWLSSLALQAFAATPPAAIPTPSLGQVITLSDHWRYHSSQNTGVHAPPTPQQFVDIPSWQFGTAEQGHWFYARLNNNTTASQQRVVRLRQAWMKRAVAFAVHRDHAPQILLDGFAQYGDAKWLKTTQPTFNIDLKPGHTDLYLYASNTYPTALQAELSDDIVTANNLADEHRWMWIMLGIAACIGLFSLSCGAPARIIGYFTLSATTLALTASGIGQVYGWPNLPELTAILFGPSLAATFACLYAAQARLLDLPSTSSIGRINRYAQIYAVLAAIALSHTTSWLVLIGLTLLLPLFATAAYVISNHSAEHRFRRWVIGIAPLAVLGGLGISGISLMNPTAWLGAALILALMFSALVMRDLLLQAGERTTAQHNAIIAKFKAKQASHDLARSDQASRAKSAFLTTMSHDIRTPMNGILGVGELLQQTQLDQQQQHYVNTLRRSGQQLMDILNDALDLSKIEAGRLQLEPVTCDLTSLLDDIEQQHKNLEMQIDKSVALSVKLDAARLRQVLKYTLDHVQHLSTGPIKLTVSDRRKPDDITQRLQFEMSYSLSNTASEIPRLSDALADLSHRQLSISSALVELMGGKLYADSATDSTNLRFSIEAPAVQPAQRSTATFTDSALKDKQVLIVDDSLTNQLVAEKVLSQWGARCTCVSSGKQALSHLSQSDPPVDLILMDWEMPEMNGDQAAQLIRELEQGTRIPIIAVTGRSRSECELQEAGMSGYLQKPIQASALAELINTLTSPHADSVQAAAHHSP